MTDEHTAPISEVEPVSVAILAGGKSRRMGQDKALIHLLPADKPMLSEVISRVGQLTDDLFVVASNRPEYAQFEVKIVADRCLDKGPLAGIATALTNSIHERCLIVSCDHPFLNVEFIRSMIATPGSWDALIPVTAGNSRQDLAEIFHTLHAIYRRRCLVEPPVLATVRGEELRERRVSLAPPRDRLLERHAERGTVRGA